MTVPVVALFKAKPGHEVALEALFRGVIAPTLAEDGCVKYEFNRCLDDPARFVWIEEWASRAALNAHLGTAHIAELFRQVPQHVEHSEVLALETLAGGFA